MYILYFDISAIVILIIVLIANGVQGLFHGRNNRLYTLVVFFSLIAAVADFLSGYGSNTYNPTETHKMLMYIYNYVYFFFHNNVVPMYFIYCFASMGVIHIIKKNKTFMIGFTFVVLLNNVLVLLNPFFRFIFYIDDNMQYCRGSLMGILYVTFFIEFIIGIYIIIKYRSYVRRDKWIVLSMIAPLNIFALVIQGVFPQILCEMFFISIELSVFVIVLLRQDESIDPVSGAKKYNSSVGVFKKMIESRAEVNVILFKYSKNKNIRIYLGQTNYERLLKETTKHINEIAKKCGLEGEVYYLDYGLWGYLTEDKNDDKVKKMASELSALFNDIYKLDEFDINIDHCICMFKCPDDIDDFSTLIRFSLNFHSLMQGKGSIINYSDFVNDVDFRIRNQIDEILAKAVENDGFEMYFQPIYSTKDKKYNSAEALIRLNTEEYGFVPPAIFIPAAEENGLMHKIGDFVIEESCKFICNSKVRELGIESVHINISATQYIEEDFSRKMLDILGKYNISPENICLEITESAADTDPEIVDKNVWMLSENGIKFALDDYGAGYSNIQHSIELPINQVKFGKQFIEDVKDKTDKVEMSIVEESFKLQKALGRSILIQGVEDKEIADFFINLGCDYVQGCEYIQGYYYCKALPVNELIDFLLETPNQNIN